MINRDRGIPVIDRDFSYTQFLDDFLRPLRPCIIVSGLTEEWPSTKRWTIQDPSKGQLIPNYRTLEEDFGEYEGCITFCDETDSNGETVQREMLVSQYIDSITRHETTRKTYLKDFHFMRVNPSLKPPYSVPKFFQGIIY